MKETNSINANETKMKTITVGDYKVTAVFSSTNNTEITAVIKTILIDSLLNQKQCINLVK